jgi:hypothetical protein
MKYIESNIPEELMVRVTHYHHGNQVDLSNGGAKYVTHAVLLDNAGHRVGQAIAVAHGRTSARCARNVRRQMAVGRAFKQWHTCHLDTEQVSRDELQQARIAKVQAD